MIAFDERKAAFPHMADNVRAGVTGHHVRHVLAFGLTGAIFAMIAAALLS